MADLLNTPASFNSELSMLLQLIALGILILGFVIVKRKSYASHGAIMFVAVLINTVAMLTVMIPVALRPADTSIPGFNLLLKSHALLGLIVEIISVYIVTDWRFQKPGPTCFQRKKWMLGLGLIWIAQVIIGMLLFMKLY